VIEKDLHDLLLLGARSLRAARARRMHDDVERSRALPAVRRVDTSAALEETANGLRTACANRAMQWSCTRPVLVLDVRAGVEEELNHRPLGGLVRGHSRIGTRIARVMKSDGSTPIFGVRVCSSVDERSDGERPERRRREMQRRIADVQLVRHFLYETLVGDARPRDFGLRADEPHRFGFVGHDRSEELVQGRRSV